jgi:hypothetical protein
MKPVECMLGISILLISSILLFCLPLTIQAKRIALVIGNGDYKDSPLKNPAHDAKDISRTLESLEFKVIEVIDANLRTMHKALDEFSLDLRKGDVALFFYAGHGLQVHGDNYLLPIDNQIRTISDVRYEAFQVGRLIGRLEEAQSLNIIILDACRNNPLGRGFNRSLERGLTVIHQKPEGTFIAYATGPGKTAADGEGGNGLFTSSLLEHMITARLELSALIRKVRADVKKKSFGAQVPWSESSLTEEFYFRVKVSPANQEQEVRIGPTVPRQDQRVDSLFWESIKDSQNPSAYEAYVKKFPDGIFKPLALMRITKYSRKEIALVDQTSVDKVQPQQPSTNPTPHLEKNDIEVVLRTSRQKISDNQLKNMLIRLNFYDKNRNPEGDFSNDYVPASGNIVRDKKTGLMWQKVGSAKKVGYQSAKKYIDRLNSEKFEGYSNWRLPTVEELASLLRSKNKRNMYIDDKFSGKQSYCWSIDSADSLSGLPDEVAVWGVNFKEGTFVKANWFNTGGMSWHSWYTHNEENYVRAVCTYKKL